MATTKDPTPFLKRAALGIVLLSIASSACSPSFELDESVLGVEDPPYTIGGTLTADTLAGLSCTQADTGLLICPVRRYDDRLFGVMVDPADPELRIRAVLVISRCATSPCAGEAEQALAHYTELLGKAPDVVEGHPIWKDRQGFGRELTITGLGDRMLAVMLLESDPETGR